VPLKFKCVPVESFCYFANLIVSDVNLLRVLTYC
jgi:hypothetical protein